MKLDVRIAHRVWLGDFSRRHPELLIECISLLALGAAGYLGEYEFFGSSRDWTDEIAEAHGIVEVERLDAAPNFGRYRIRFRQAVVATLAARYEVLIRYPRKLMNGILSVELVARLSRMRRLVAILAKGGLEPQLVSLGRASLRSAPLILTPVQRSLFRQALALGYFEVPRRITLTGLAGKVGRSKSSVSRTLAAVEQKLAQIAARSGA
jgi:predicted DNA binding protein